MRKQNTAIGGIILVGLGVLLLLQVLTAFNPWRLWPLILVAIGAWVLLQRPKVAEGAFAHEQVLGDIKREGRWDVRSESVWIGVGDVRLDFMQADVPQGETPFYVGGLVGDVRLNVPPGVGVLIEGWRGVGSVRFGGQKQDTFLTSFQYATPGYESAPRRIRLETHRLIGDVKVQLSEALPAPARDVAPGSSQPLR